ncbi:MAG: type II secretion system F family protein, partial [Candidatus Riflebacteria bacterium]|nr:type II secretion system F family protein [Candidatus Riflebacteria bacterium]
QDLRLAVNATIFQQETGGNLEDLYTQILQTISERKKIMGKIVAGTAHARLSGNLVATIPVILAIILLNMQPDYLKPMFTNPYGQIALLLAVAATIIGVVFINRMTTSILPDAEEAMISKNESSIKGKSKYKVLRLILKPFEAFMAMLPSNLTNKLKNETKFLLNASGKSAVFEVSEYIGLMALSMVVFAIIMMLFVNPSTMGAWAWLVLIFLLPIGFRLPRIYLAHLIRKRQKNIEFELPYVIDLLSLAIESGLDLTGGIAKVVEKSRNTDIIVEFKMFLADIKVGKSMEEALADMAERVKVLSFFSFVSSLIQAQRLGADIGPTLRAQAEQMRYQRLILAEERVNKLPVKLLIPLVFFVFPSISVLLIGPAMIQIQTKFPKPEQLESEKTETVKKENIGVLNTNSNQSAKPAKTMQPVQPVQPVKTTPEPVKNNVYQQQSNSSGNKQNENVQPTVIHVPATIVIEEKASPKEQKVDTMPVVPSVTPAPIVITEPVAAPPAPAPVTIIEPKKESIKEPTDSNQSSLEKEVSPSAIAVPVSIEVPGEKSVTEVGNEKSAQEKNRD